MRMRESWQSRDVGQLFLMLFQMPIYTA
jgi:hypothetical protein